MALVWLDRVMEETSSTGTGSLTLGGAVTGHRTFAGVGDGNTCYYCVYAVDSSGNPSGVWETGLGTWATGGTLARTTVHANSSGTQTALDLAAGTKRVILTPTANHMTTIPVVNGGTGLTALGSALQVLRVNSGGTALEYGTLSTGLTVGTTAISSGTSGRLLYDAAGVVGETAAIAYATSGTHLTLTAQAATDVPVKVKGATSQSANLQEWQDSAGTVLSYISKEGYVSSPTIELVFKTSGGTASVSGSHFYGAGFLSSGSGYSLTEASTPGGLRLSDSRVIVWNSGASVYGGTWDTGLARSAAGVVKVTDGSSGLGSLAVGCYTSSTVGLTVSGAASQTAPLLAGQLVSSTAAKRDAFDLTAAWADSTDATRKARLVVNAYDTAARECLRLEASGSAAMVGLYGTAATAQYATTGTVTGYTGGGGTALTHSDTFTGNTGSTAYTISDIVRSLKLIGIMAS